MRSPVWHAPRPCWSTSTTERVAVAVETDLADVLAVPRGLALLPVLLAAAAVEPGATGGQGAPEGLGVHVGEREHRPVGGVLDDGGHEAVGVLGEVDGARDVLVDRQRHALGNGGGRVGPGPGAAQR